MSEYHLQTTEFNDEECLVDALVDIGYKREVIEVHDQPTQLLDYMGRPTHYVEKSGDKANIIIRRRNIGYGSANDLGFRRNADGTISAFISDFDSASNHWGYQGDRFLKLKDAYAERKTMKTAAKQGFKFLGKKVVNGKTRLQFLDTRA